MYAFLPVSLSACSIDRRTYTVHSIATVCLYYLCLFSVCPFVFFSVFDCILAFVSLISLSCVQYFDIVGWVTGRPSGQLLTEKLSIGIVIAVIWLELPSCHHRATCTVQDALTFWYLLSQFVRPVHVPGL